MNARKTTAILLAAASIIAAGCSPTLTGKDSGAAKATITLDIAMPDIDAIMAEYTGSGSSARVVDSNSGCINVYLGQGENEITALYQCTFSGMIKAMASGRTEAKAAKKRSVVSAAVDPGYYDYARFEILDESAQNVLTLGRTSAPFTLKTGETTTLVMTGLPNPITLQALADRNIIEGEYIVGSGTTQHFAYPVMAGRLYQITIADGNDNEGILFEYDYLGHIANVCMGYGIETSYSVADFSDYDSDGMAYLGYYAISGDAALSLSIAEIKMPSILAVSQGNSQKCPPDSTLLLTWDMCFGASGYTLYRSNAEGEFDEIYTTDYYSSNGYIDGGLLPSTTYSYKVAVLYGALESPLESAVASGTTAAEGTPPTTISIGIQ